MVLGQLFPIRKLDLSAFASLSSEGRVFITLPSYKTRFVSSYYTQNAPLFSSLFATYNPIRPSPAA